MTRNASLFPFPKPPLAAIEAAIAAFADAQTATYTRAAGKVADRDARRRDLDVLLDQICHYVQQTADADREHATSIIEYSGIHVKKTRSLPRRVFTATSGRVSGQVILRAPRAGNRAGYEWEYSTDGMKTWVSLGFTVRASTTVDGIMPGATVYCRYRCVTKDGTGDWSDWVSIIVT
jgi:hypothetical protein